MRDAGAVARNRIIVAGIRLGELLKTLTGEAVTPNDNRGMARRFREISIVLLLGTTAALFATCSTRKMSQQDSIETSVEYVVEIVRMGMVTPEELAYFQVLAGDLRFQHVTVRTDSGKP